MLLATACGGGSEQASGDMEATVPEPTPAPTAETQAAGDPDPPAPDEDHMWDEELFRFLSRLDGRRTWREALTATRAEWDAPIAGDWPERLWRLGLLSRPDEHVATSPDVTIAGPVSVQQVTVTGRHAGYPPRRE